MLTKRLSPLHLSSAILAVISPAIFPASAQPQTARFDRYVRYKGAWFNIDYPRGWMVMPLSPSKTSTTGSDSARFTSPSGDAEFYIFSPQWNGDPREIALNPAKERLVSHRVERTTRTKLSGGGFQSNNMVNWYTVRAKDNSYERSWVDVEDKVLSVRHVFGIKYRDAQAYKKHQAQYEHFRNSLEQFSD